MREMTAQFKRYGFGKAFILSIWILIFGIAFTMTIVLAIIGIPLIIIGILFLLPPIYGKYYEGKCPNCKRSMSTKNADFTICKKCQIRIVIIRE